MAQKEEPNMLQELKRALKAKELGRLYFFYGEETFLLNHYLGQVKKLLLDPLTESFNFHRMNNETFDIRSFADAVENMPMMAESTLVQVDEVDPFQMNEGERTQMAEILSDIPDYCTVVFTYTASLWKPDKRLKKLWDAVNANAVLVEFAKQNQRDLIAWITRHFAAHNKQISTDLCAYLIEITDGTMTTLSGEIEKICSYSGADQIRRTDIDAVTEPVLDAVVFQISNALCEGRYDIALQKLQQVLKMQQEPIAILGTIGAQFRKISTARILLDHGRNASDLQKLYGLSDFVARKTMDSARRFKPEFCKKAAELVLETDRKLKTSFDDEVRLLELLILQLAQEARNG